VTPAALNTRIYADVLGGRVVGGRVVLHLANAWTVWVVFGCGSEHTMWASLVSLEDYGVSATRRRVACIEAMLRMSP
jgi:hypothetical protein